MNPEQSNVAAERPGANTQGPRSGSSSAFKHSEGAKAAAGASGLGNIPAGQGLPQIIFPPLSARPCYICYDVPFLADNRYYTEGVYRHGIEQGKDTLGGVIDVPIDDWITSVARILSIVRSDSGNEHAYLLEYIPHGETEKRRTVLLQSSLLGRGEEAMKQLRDLGISVLNHNIKFIRDYLDREHLKFSHRKTPDDFWTSVKMVGWSPVGERFVFPDKIIGAQTGVWFSGRNDIAPYRKNGEFSLWQDNVAVPCDGNSYLILALSCAFTGPLLEILNIPGLGVHLYGNSTTGKTTALAVATSTWDGPQFMLTWRSTVNGFEAQAKSRCSTLFPIDESSQADPRAVGDIVYMLLNGTAKGRMKKDMSPQEVGRWRIPVLSSGERSIETHQTSAKIEHKVGQTVRIIDVPVVKSQYGLFEDIHSAADGREFSDSLRDAASKHYGNAGPMFVAELIKRYATLDLSTRLSDILQEFGKDLSAQDARVARSFAVCALAGELAIEWKILPWQPRTAILAAATIFAYWHRTQPQTTKSKEDAQILKNLSDFLNVYGDTRFTDIKPKTYTDYTDPKNPVVRRYENQPLPKDVRRAGYWDDSSGRRVYLLFSAALVEAGKFELSRILEALEAVDAFAAKGPKGEKAKRRRTPDGGNPTLYWIDPEKLEL